MTDERGHGDAGDTSDDRGDSNSDPDGTDPDDIAPDDTSDSLTGPMTDIATDADDTPDTNRAARTTDPESDAKEDTQRDSNGDDGRFGRLSTDDLRGLIDRIGLAALILLALIAGWGFYSQAGRPSDPDVARPGLPADRPRRVQLRSATRGACRRRPPALPDPPERVGRLRKDK